MSKPVISTTGWGPWRKTTVTHAGKTHVFSGDAEVKTSANGICVTEKGILSENTSCFLNQTPGSPGTSLPNGNITGRSKAVELAMADGSVQKFEGNPFGVVSVQKEGNTLSVVEHGVFSNKVIASVPVSNVAAVSSDHCAVCEAINPLFNGKK